MTRPEQLSLSDQELSRPALLLGQRFVQRWDMYAQQLKDGNYICVRRVLNVGHLLAHLKEEITLGTYVLDVQSRGRFLVLDADDERSWGSVRHLAQTLAQEDVTAYLEKSRRGGHLWLFLAEAVPGKDIRAFGLGILAAHGVKEVELFPKQERLTGGPGSLIRMPFGVHRLTGRRYGFYLPGGSPLGCTIREQIQVLSVPQTVSEAAFEAYRAYASADPVSADFTPTEVPTNVLSERIKASVTVLEFVSQYVDLKLAKSGAIGLCPFHDDHYPSFGVNTEGNYWHCFAGCGGGSVIDFWMRWRRCDFTTAVKELAGMVLQT